LPRHLTAHAVPRAADAGRTNHDIGRCPHANLFGQLSEFRRESDPKLRPARQRISLRRIVDLQAQAQVSHGRADRNRRIARQEILTADIDRTGRGLTRRRITASARATCHQTQNLQREADRQAIAKWRGKARGENHAGIPRRALR
jgi:hypothetical protein